MRIASWGHAVFAVTMIALGVVGFVQHDFAVIWQPVAPGFPARVVLVYLCAVVSLGCGVGLLLPRAASQASRLLLASLLAWFVLVRMPQVFLAASIGTVWAAAQVAVQVAAAWVLYVWFAGDGDKQRFSFATGDAGLRIARTFLGLALIPFGLAHFMYLQNTAPLVPAWLPWHVAWAYCTGAAFIAAGIAVLGSVYARLAATLATAQVGLFTLLVWVPVVLATPKPSDWSEFTVSVAITAAAWVVADSFRGTPWLAIGRPPQLIPDPSAI